MSEETPDIGRFHEALKGHALRIQNLEDHVNRVMDAKFAEFEAQIGRKMHEVHDQLDFCDMPSLQKLNQCLVDHDWMRLAINDLALQIKSSATIHNLDGVLCTNTIVPNKADE